MKREFFVLTGGPDGTHFNGPLNEAELLIRITPDENGETYYGSRSNFLKKIPDLEYMDESEILIIEGKIVQPQPRAVVTEYEV